MIAALVIHSCIYEYRVTINAGGRVTECDIIYSPNSSGKYSITGACLTPLGKYVKVLENQSLYNIMSKAVKVGSEDGAVMLKVSGKVLRVKYELIGKYEVTLLSNIGVGLISIIALLAIAGATYTIINWRKYVIH